MNKGVIKMKNNNLKFNDISLLRRNIKTYDDLKNNLDILENNCEYVGKNTFIFFMRTNIKLFLLLDIFANLMTFIFLALMYHSSETFKNVNVLITIAVTVNIIFNIYFYSFYFLIERPFIKYIVKVGNETIVFIKDKLNENKDICKFLSPDDVNKINKELLYINDKLLDKYLHRSNKDGK